MKILKRFIVVILGLPVALLWMAIVATWMIITPIVWIFVGGDMEYLWEEGMDFLLDNPVNDFFRDSWFFKSL